MYIVIFTYLVLADDVYGLKGWPTLATWYYCLIYSGLLVKFELQQFRFTLTRLNSAVDYFVDAYNWLDIVSGAIAILALAQMRTQEEQDEFSDVVQALAVLLRGTKVTYFLRGNPSTAPLINMLRKIVKDMWSFLVVLAIVLVA
eukprot:COSAG04_NODE_1082_length_8397_cov_3.936009_1_plen_144_part_00